MRHADFESRKSLHKKGGGAEKNCLIIKELSLLINCCNVIYQC